MTAANGAKSSSTQIVDRKSPLYWLPSQQGWTWIITIAWMAVANFWPPFGLYGFVCMFTPIILALAGWGKMSCARLCPRGSFIGKFTKRISLGLPMPHWMHTKPFRLGLWAAMMGTFLCLLIWAIPQGIYVLGRTILIFMESATGLAFLFGILFHPRGWCTVCPMGFTSGNIRTGVRRFDLWRRQRRGMNA